MPGLDVFMDRDGEDFDVQGEGRNLVARGLTHTKQQYIGFYPDTDVKAGYLLRGQTSGNEFKVVRVERTIQNGEVFQVKAYYEKSVKQEARNIVTVGQMVGSALQLDSPGATQTVTLTITADKKAALLDTIKDLRAVLDQLGLSDEDKEEVEAEAGVIESSLKKRTPQVSVISTSVEAVKNILVKYSGKAVKAGTAAIASGLVDRLIAWLSSN